MHSSLLKYHHNGSSFQQQVTVISDSLNDVYNTWSLLPAPAAASLGEGDPVSSWDRVMIHHAKTDCYLSTNNKYHAMPRTQ